MKFADARQNRSSVKWVSVVGARPQFVKLAPVCRAIDDHNERRGTPRIEHCIIHTGQHYDRDIDEVLFTQTGIPKPKYNLAAGSGSHGTQLARMLARLEPILNSERADWVVVYGDTNSTLAGALLAARLKQPLAHVEAGCRSGDLGMPEEQCRIIADHLSRLLLAPSHSAIENLRREGIGSQNGLGNRRCVMVGDLMYDALLQHRQSANEFANETLKQFGLKSGEYYLLTIHRAENTDSRDRLDGILRAAASLDLPVLFPVHPRTRRVLDAAGISLNGNLRPVSPLGYFEMLAVESHARKILTDSGGVQKEAFFLGVPCVILRDRTEWPETVELGANRIAGTAPESIREAVHANHKPKPLAAKPYGDGDAARRIVGELLTSTAQ